MGWGLKSLAAVPLLALAACGGGGPPSAPAGGGTAGTSPPPAPTPTAAPAQDLFAAPAQESLSVADVQQIIAQAAAQATSQGVPATIAVVDRVGNVLGVFVMPGARDFVAIPGAPNGQDVDIQGLDVPAAGSAIAKAITGAYLSSAGNAFSTRVASQIVQEHFPPSPTTLGLESGPLFGVQFSQLPCSDFSARAVDGLIGPKRSPLGLSADPGGFPLYKNGVVVGGIGVAADPDYTFDPNVLDIDVDTDEFIALAGTIGFEAPVEIRADRISADGTNFRFTDATYGALADVAGASFTGTAGTVASVNGYSDGVIIAGTAYGTEASGIRPATNAEFSLGGAFVMSDGAGNNRFPIRGGTDGADVGEPITQAEATAILEEAFIVISRARGQIRRPLDSQAQVTLSLVDTRGANPWDCPFC